MSIRSGQEDDSAISKVDIPSQERHQSSPSPLDLGLRNVLEALPEAIYMTDANGLITFYNEAAVLLWGVHPTLGKSQFCGSWKLYWPDGTHLPHDECPMSMALAQKRPVRGLEAIAERPDGSRVRFLACPSPIFDATGALCGAVNMLIDLTDRTLADEAARRHDAIVESSDDAIVAKDLNGIITNWNSGAQRLFGYTREEAIGKPIEMLIPLDRKDEEPGILKRIRLGERIEHYETIRRRKDGSLVEISLSVSPVRNREGRIIGAAKIARDITDRRQAEAQKSLLIKELDHRVKNLFTLANSVIALSARSVKTSGELAIAVTDRLTALAQAHSLTIPNGFSSEQATTLHTLIQTIFAPYSTAGYNSQSRALVTGSDLTITGSTVTSFALLLHELATNAAKYGALSLPEGFVDISCSEDAGVFTLVWCERNGPKIEREPDSAGFGTFLTKSTVRGQLHGELTREWNSEGLIIRLAFVASLCK
ncbi:PAS domain S-box-containing protein [Pseudomonas arsenicoxydans]|uniref:histidine kinase n=1 Tax=Pseudomonas arsenicoxydans TaxID=702115 RepID=A0A1H0NZM0_9PSED|nr:PAS domain S-box protein [Pseudomonas arsenicoxydans]SDO97958.1 PAS domain S-box-containing protein [Pseudomonas arsenicoxydans]